MQTLTVNRNDPNLPSDEEVEDILEQFSWEVIIDSLIDSESDG